MKKVIDLTGRRFGRLTVTDAAERTGRRITWLCICACGNEKVVRGDHLKSGHTASCGCLPSGNRTHGQRNTPLYGRWASMVSRTTNPNHPRYPDYGGRGITVCERWKSFEGFAEDMGSTFSPELSLERIDNGRGYEPGNCRWATVIEQARNKRSSHLVTFRGQTKTIAEWAELLGLNYETVHTRLGKQGWPVDRALMTGADQQALSQFGTSASTTCEGTLEG